MFIFTELLKEMVEYSYKVLFMKSWLVEFFFNWIKIEVHWNHMACDWGKKDREELVLVAGMTGIQLEMIWLHVLV